MIFRLIIFCITIMSAMLTLTAQSNLEKLDYANKIYYSKADSSFSICNELEGKVQNNNELGEVYLCQGRYFILKTNFDKASILLNKAMLIFEKENNISQQARCHSLKSILFGRISDKKKAKFHQQKSLELYTIANDIDGQISTLTNISLDFIETNQNDSTFYYLLKLKRFFSKMSEKSKYFFHQNFGTYYYNVRNYDAAIVEYNKAFVLANKLNMVDSKATLLMLLSSPYIGLKKYNLAEETLNKSIAIATKYELLYESNEAYGLLIKLYEKLGNYRKAYELNKLNTKIENEIYNLEKINRINEIETRLKLTEKEKIITQKELEIKSEQLNTIEEKSKVSQLIFVVILSLIIMFFVIIILFRVKKLNNRIKHQKQLLEEKNTEITDSITYAKRIQAAILPSISSFQELIPNSFIIYLPKDIVAGDFYWTKKVGDTVLYATADCTGHGVPGAMVSVVCSNALNESVKELQSGQPAQILEKTRAIVKENLAFDLGDVTDGMDIVLCAINLKKLELFFSGANNPLYIIRNKELIEFKGDKQPVGNHYKEIPFTEHQFKLQKGDVIYSFSDGYPDQFGGPKGKKFMAKRFRKLLLKIVDEPMPKQQDILTQNFNDWKGNLEQIDDVCVIGVSV